MTSVLFVTEHFLPGYLGGGPIQSANNMFHRLSSENLHFYCITNSYDLGFPLKQFKLPKDCWISSPPFFTLYTSAPLHLSIRFVSALFRHKNNILYLNSFFAPSSIIIYFLYFFYLLHPSRLIIAPRGELYPGALSSKGLKKSIFLSLFRLFSFIRPVCFHATCIDESHFIKSHFCSTTIVAPNLPRIPLDLPATSADSSILNCVFYSRLVPKKNLLFLLCALKEFDCAVNLSIYGPIEDDLYWQRCLSAISDLPSSINAVYKGSLLPDEVFDTLSKYELFILPTLGENFGHVVYESLASGTPVIISNKTPWSSSDCPAITTFNLESYDSLIGCLTEFASLSPQSKVRLSEQASDYAREFYSSIDLNGYRDLFHE